MLEWTGERYLPYGDPALYGTEIHYEHLHRYAFASQFVQGKKVLDLASGEGYGAFILSKNAQSVVGIEIDPAAVTHAMNTYNTKNIRFIEGSILNIPIEGEKLFDVIVCFEAIEHVKEHDILLNEIRRLLKNDGLVIISTPDKKQYSEEAGYQNPYHLKELYQSEFSELLQKYFSYVYLSGQQILSGSSIFPLLSKENNSSSEFIIEYKDQHFSFTEKNEIDPRYFVAIASNTELNPNEIQKSYLIDKSNIEYSLSAGQRNRISDLSTHAHNLEAIVADRDNRISELSIQAHNLEKIISDKETHISDLRKYTRTLEEIISNKDLQINALQKPTHNLEAIVADKELQITDLQKHAHNLEIIVTAKESQITDLQKHAHNLEIIVTARESQITELQKHAHNLELIVADRESQITEFRKHTHNLEEIITNQNQQLQEVIWFNQSLKNENQSMKQSLTFNLTTKFHKKIIERLLPQNTRRRKYYNLGLSGSRILINEGWDRFWQCYRERNRPRASITDHSIPIRQTDIPILQTDIPIPQTENETEKSDDIPVIQTTVSIIIPTKNAGPDFQSVLEKIRNQKGIPPVEIIIVDSGSTDGTLVVAEKFGCRNFSIEPEEFNHGRTRNYGAEQATGEFIVFLVQDAIPIGDYWLYNMVKTLSADDHLAAASCRQVPRSDADLFACYSMWNHYTAMGFFQDKIISIEKDRFRQLPFSEKRKLAGIDDVCSCFRKDIFDQLKFENLNFAEDLGIGIRLIENGYKLAFLYSVGVIHSHNRDAEYFLRRYYVDSKSLAEMADATATPDNRDLIQVINSFKAGYLNMKNSLTRIKTQYPDEISVDHFFSVLKHDLDSNNYLNTKCPEETKLEKLLSEIFALSTSDSVDITQFTRELSGILGDFQKYIKNQCDNHNTNELIENAYKFFAIYFGSHVGSLYAQHSTDKTMQSIDAILKKGV